jgi:importin subunit alpha-2
LYFSSPDLQFESALTNIASVMSDQTIAVVSAVAVAGYISVLDSPHPVVAEQDVWALSNIACDGPELRDHLIEKSIIKPLLHFITPDALVNLFDIFIE